MRQARFLTGPATMRDPIHSHKEKIMATFTAAQIEEHARALTETLEDGFQWTDMGKIVSESMQIVEDVVDMTNEEKYESAIAIANYVIDNTDTPWVPDGLVDPILKKAVPWIIELVIDASKGKIVNKD